MFSSCVYYGPSPHRLFRIVVTSFENGNTEVRFHGEVQTGDGDQVVVEFTGVDGRFDDPQPALRDAAQRARLGRITWLQPGNSDWIVDGDALRAKSDGLHGLPWLTGTAAITPRYEAQEMLRLGNFASRGRVILSFDQMTWAQARKPWEKNWQVSTENGRSGGQGTVRPVQSRTTPKQFGALKVLHDEHQGNRERRYRLFREVQALEYMAGKGTPSLYESNASAYNDPQQIIYAVTEFINGPTLSAAVSKKRFDVASARTACETLCETLERLHRAGHKHRDLKPDNVILRNDSNDPVLVDFGMASASDEDDESFRTEANQEIGNRFLRLPEYSAGAHLDDPRSDITQLIGLFYYMITGITPRLLVDSDGRRPHEREHARLTVLRKPKQWPRLRALFDEAFAIELHKRIPDLPTLRDRLRSLDEPLADPETLQEIERLARAAAHPDLRSQAERHATLVAFSERFVSRVRDILHNANVEIETADRLSPADRHAEVSIAARLPDRTSPMVNVRHHLYFDNDGWHGEFHSDDGQPVAYLTMSNAADISEIQQAIDLGAARVVKNLVRYLNYQVQRLPELRRATPGARTRLTDLRGEYPIGIDVNVEREQMGRRLALLFQNNSGVTQPDFSAVLLFPLALRATIDGMPSVKQEDKYDRFTFDITAALPDCATTAGPIVHLAGDPVTVPPDGHIFFQLKAGDSQFTKSIRIEDVFGPSEAHGAE